MANNQYTSVSVVNYNANPPNDDGSQVASNLVTWDFHKDKLGDPLKTALELINTRVLAAFAKTINIDTDEQNAMAGSLAFTGQTETIASGAITPTSTFVTVAAETSTTDDLDTITVTSISDGAILILVADSGDTITLKDASDNINLADNADYDLTGDHVIVLQRRGTDLYEVCRSNQDSYPAAGTTLTKNPVAFSSTTTQAHGLGAEPDLLDVVMECLTGEQGYSAGDRVRPLVGGMDAVTNGGIAVLKDSTNVVLIIGAGIRILHKTSYTSQTVTAANWKIEIVPWRLA